MGKQKAQHINKNSKQKGSQHLNNGNIGMNKNKHIMKNREQNNKSNSHNNKNKLGQANKKDNTNHSKVTNKEFGLNEKQTKNLNEKVANRNQKPKTNEIKDQRFARAAYDPKFLRPKRQLTKVKVDSRFNKMLTDPAFKNLSKVDKYGRKIQEKRGQQDNEELKQFYTYENDNKAQQMEVEGSQQNQEEQEFDEDNEQQSQQQNDDIEEEKGSGQQDEEQLQQESQEAGETNIRKWMEEYDQQSSSLADMPIQELIQEENQAPQLWSDDEQNLIKNQDVKPTKRLALCNYDWMNISSKDLMILFNSFKSPSGFIKSIQVYQSLLGKEKMEQEEMFGPQGIWNEDQGNFVVQQQKKIKKGRKSWKELLNKEDSSALDSRKLRAYQKERLRYYYAIIECDSKNTADQIYKECDGNQFESSNLQFDLRFIPDDISFDKNLLKQECNQMPVSGEVKNFVNRAMGHSKVQLTWQDPQLSLPASLKKKNWGKMTEQQLNKIDWSTYLNQEEVEQEDNKKELFFQKDQNEMVPDWKKQCNKKYKNQSQNKQLVITFDSGFSQPKGLKQNKDSEVPSLKKQKKSKKQLWQRAQQQKKKRRQDLALITQNKDEQERQKNFQPNLVDQRFKAVFQNPLYSIDPSNPRFDHKKSGNIFKEVVQRNKKKNLL